VQASERATADVRRCCALSRVTCGLGFVFNGDKVAVTVHVPGVDRLRARENDDRNYEVLTVAQGRITAMRACKNHTEALSAAGIA
jgi:hypothetical protein